MKKKSTTSCYTRISRRFINGLILLVPIVITIFVVVEVLNITEGLVGKHFPFYFPGLGLIIVLLTIYLVGWGSSYWLMRRVIGIGESLLGKIPIVKFIYNSVKHLSTAVFESNNMFDKVVLVPYHQSMALGFVMAAVPEPLEEKLGADYVCVFIPWSINMTSGTNLFVKKSDVIPLDISSESALQYMLTAGAVMPKRIGGGNGAAGESLAASAGVARAEAARVVAASRAPRVIVHDVAGSAGEDNDGRV